MNKFNYILGTTVVAFISAIYLFSKNGQETDGLPPITEIKESQSGSGTTLQRIVTGNTNPLELGLELKVKQPPSSSDTSQNPAELIRNAIKFAFFEEICP